MQCVDLRQVGKRALESLIRVGALDRFGERRALLEVMDRIVAISTSHFKAASSGQLSIFGMVESVVEEIVLPQATSLDPREQLEWERELMGLYVSSHPMSPYNDFLKKKVTRYSSQLAGMKDKTPVTVGGMVMRVRRHQTKTGKDMGFVTIEDMQGPIDLVIFPNAWKQYSQLLQVDKILIVEGKVDGEGNDPKVLVDKISEPLEEELMAALDGFQETTPEEDVEEAYELDYGYEISIGMDDGAEDNSEEFVTTIYARKSEV